MIVDDGDDFLALLVLVARVANAIVPFLATVLVPSPWSTLTSSCFSAERCRVAYLLAADILSSPLLSHLCRLTQPVMSPTNRFSTPRSPRLTCL